MPGEVLSRLGLWRSMDSKIHHVRCRRILFWGRDAGAVCVAPSSPWPEQRCGGWERFWHFASSTILPGLACLPYLNEGKALHLPALHLVPHISKMFSALTFRVLRRVLRYERPQVHPVQHGLWDSVVVWSLCPYEVLLEPIPSLFVRLLLRGSIALHW